MTGKLLAVDDLSLNILHCCDVTSIVLLFLHIEGDDLRSHCLKSKVNIHKLPHYLHYNLSIAFYTALATVSSLIFK